MLLLLFIVCSLTSRKRPPLAATAAAISLEVASSTVDIALAC
jgi:hypothetical protein